MKKTALILLLLIYSYGNLSWGQSDSAVFAIPHSNDFLYEHYAVRQDLTVAQIVGYKVDSNVVVDVVMLMADDSVAWENLLEEFSIQKFSLIPNSENIKTRKATFDKRAFCDPRRHVIDTLNEKDCIMIVSFDTKTLWFYYYKTVEESNIILRNYVIKNFSTHEKKD